MTDFYAPITYSWVSKPILNDLETTSTGLVKFYKQSIVARVKALSLSVFLALDCAFQLAAGLIKLSLCLMLKTGVKVLSPQDYSFQVVGDHFSNAAECYIGIYCGSILGFLAPSLIVPRFFKPDSNPFKGPKADHSEGYHFKYFDRIFIVSQDEAKHKKMAAYMKAIGELGKTEIEPFNTIKAKALLESEIKLMPGKDQAEKNQRMLRYYKHMQILKHSYDKGYDSVLIVDDETEFAGTKTARDLFNKAMLDLPKDHWDVLYLGVEHELMPKTCTLSDCLQIPESGLKTSAYAVHNRSKMKALSKDLEHAIEVNTEILPIDEFHAYTVQKSLAYQVFSMKPSIAKSPAFHPEWLDFYTDFKAQYLMPVYRFFKPVQPLKL